MQFWIYLDSNLDLPPSAGMGDYFFIEFGVGGLDLHIQGVETIKKCSSAN